MKTIVRERSAPAKLRFDSAAVAGPFFGTVAQIIQPSRLSSLPPASEHSVRGRPSSQDFDSLSDLHHESAIGCDDERPLASLGAGGQMDTDQDHCLPDGVLDQRFGAIKRSKSKFRSTAETSRPVSVMAAGLNCDETSRNSWRLRPAGTLITHPRPAGVLTLADEISAVKRQERFRLRRR